ncbi:MAG: hypothetical protein Kow0032_16130 [Methyloligellaceae bacterium]
MWQGLAACAVGVTAAAFAAQPAASQQPYPPANVPYPGAGGQQPPSPHEMRCFQLEQELANDWARQQQGSDELPRIRADIRKYDSIYQRTRAQAERAGCYESLFIFGRQLKRTPRCLRLHRRIEDARRQLARLNAEQDSLSRGGSARQRQDELIAALARAGCGQQYRQETRRRGGGGWFTSLFEEETYNSRRERPETSRIVPFGTYRTLCVRSCDGYYFPISYSTLPSHFANDVQQCRSQCAAPAELFVHRNPGEEAEQMVSADGSRAYTDLPNAWRYRREYVKGCSCKQSEYDPAAIAEYEQKKAAEKAAKAGGTPASGATPPDNRVAQEPEKAPKQQ